MLFSQDHWLNAHYGPDGWAAARVLDEGDGSPRGHWPYHIESRWGGRLRTQVPPPLSLFHGPSLFPPADLTRPNRLADFTHRTLAALTEQLPPAELRVIKTPYDFTGGLALQMLGWQERVAYSYVLPTAVGEETLWRNLPGRRRTDIRKARKQLEIRSGAAIEEVDRLYRRVFRERGVNYPLPAGLLLRLDTSLRPRGIVDCLAAVDERGIIHATAWYLRDERSMYNLVLAADPTYRSSGAAVLLLWEGIRLAAERGLDFDFEGSRLAGVEPFYRSFGGEARPYSVFTRQRGLGKLFGLREWWRS